MNIQKAFYIAMQMLQTAFIIQLNCLPKAPIIHPTETKKSNRSMKLWR